MTNPVLDVIGAIKLKILVFGPQVHTPSLVEREAKFQNKRMEIRAKLEALGHTVKYAEDLVDATIGGPEGNAVFQEIVIMLEYDLIVTLVESPGSIVEATVIATNPKLAAKSVLFQDQAYSGGLVRQCCDNAVDLGAHFDTISYPDDLDQCHLYGKVLKRVSQIQKVKFLL
ncbi:hypothetical protein RFM26_08600 [Mesorhizobium sp. VK23B]|uniref:Uncharacterized protein n=1 Tax=Mesorhizobium dulcispinae TaxID=3072316 RepID=A0ABU4XCW0_9HYPH|nr:MULTISPECIES: hypothetical protein [unclassified Mesorhizobium]MDX8465741.1 hypothetical protein [Mesorhizobium sp. VK23B]MDX8471457.1 hypothetical protein [Mesorhizobium sp. VK23A]